MALNFFAWQEVFKLESPQVLKVDFLDVGQGDSIFIETPQKHQILIDGGPNSNVLQKLADRMPFWDKEIDLIILTHPEKDHMAGILDVLQRYKVDYFLWTGIVKNNAENKKLVEILKEKNTIKVLTASVGEKIKAGNAEIDILFPFVNLAGKEIKNTSNDDSVVTKLIFGKNSFLFTGDISSVAGKKLENISADVLKVAHHGSKYSTSDSFLENVRPEYAVISVGKNSYGHPTSEVLQRLKKYDIKVLRTDQFGDVNILSDGNTTKILNNKF